LACFYCNSYKGDNVAGYDPLTDSISRLFHPRTDEWDQHFAWNGPLLEGQTEVGRTTIEVLRINDPGRVALRRVLIELGELRIT
jgi:hypothetical protein